MIVKIVWIVLLLVTSAVLLMGLPLNENPELLSYSSSRSDNGYDFSYSIDGQSRDEHAMIILQKDGDKEVEFLEIRGSYSFVGDDNHYYIVNYVSGIDGYRANLTISTLPDEETPKVPYIAPLVLKSLVG
ncbi:uncharacterized protein LOC129803909 [Phlebotomus papatasi]|uniref:uncharacterized protein LOC129803909 n=1 Tax=Phlebotomus papatasi TaxID=29031 RepID=UPI0024838982|nr:uncharacterized protein LOC129803909 [Phlebotomus papatasi]